MKAEIRRAARLVFPGKQSVWLLVFALVVSAVFWAYTISGQNSLKDLQAPLNFTGVPDGMMISGADRVSVVTVEFKGSPEVLSRVKEGDVDVSVDVGNLVPGPQLLSIGRSDVRLPGSVSFVKVYPSVLHFSLDKRISARVPLKAVFKGRVPKDRQLLDWSIAPPEALVGGPESVVRGIKSLPTHAVVLDGHDQDFQVSVTPNLKGIAAVTLKSAQPFLLSVTIGEKRIQRTIGPVAIQILNAKGRFIVKPAVLKVMVDGPASLINSLRPEDFVAEVNVIHLKPRVEPYRLRPAVRLSNPDLADQVKITGDRKSVV